MSPKIDDPEDIKRLKDYGDELASLRTDLEKAKAGSAKQDALMAEIEKIKLEVSKLIGSSANAEVEVQDHWAGYWSGLLA